MQAFLGYMLSESEVEGYLRGREGCLEHLPEGASLGHKVNEVLRRQGAKERVLRARRNGGDVPGDFILRVRRFDVRPYDVALASRMLESDELKVLKADLGTSGPLVSQAFA